jgi:hypothetical protein
VALELVAQGHEIFVMAAVEQFRALVADFFGAVETIVYVWGTQGRKYSIIENFINFFRWDGHRLVIFDLNGVVIGGGGHQIEDIDTIQ